MVLAETMNLVTMNGTAMSPANSIKSSNDSLLKSTDNVHYECRDQFCFIVRNTATNSPNFSLWNTETGEQVYSLEHRFGDDFQITCSNIWWSSVSRMNKRRRTNSAQSDDMNSVIGLGTKQGTILLYSLAKDEKIAELSTNRCEQQVTSISFHNSSLFASYDDGTIIEWNMNNKTAKHRYSTVVNDIDRIEPLDDKTILLSSKNDFIIRQFCMKKKNILKSFSGHKSPINCLQSLIVNDSHFFLSSAVDDNYVTVWDLSKASKPNALARFLLNEPPKAFHVSSLCEFNWCLLVVARNGELYVFQDSYNLINRNSSLNQNGRRVVPTVEIVPTFQIQLQINSVRTDLHYSTVTTLVDDDVKKSKILLIYEQHKNESEPLFTTLTIDEIENAHLNDENIINFNKNGSLIKSLSRKSKKSMNNSVNNNNNNNNSSNNIVNNKSSNNITNNNNDKDTRNANTNGEVCDSPESYVTTTEDMMDSGMENSRNDDDDEDDDDDGEDSDDQPVMSQSNVKRLSFRPTSMDYCDAVSSHGEAGDYSSSNLVNIFTQNSEISFEEFSNVINNTNIDSFNDAIKKMQNTQIMNVFHLLQDSLLHKFVGQVDRQKCVLLMTSLVKHKFDYLQNVPSIKKELATMKQVIEQRSRVIIDSNRILGRLQLILRKNSSSK